MRVKRIFIGLVVVLGVCAAGRGFGQWTTAARESAETGDGGVLKKVWVKVSDAPVYESETGDAVAARLRQHSKAYHFGEAGDGRIAVGDKPRRADCAHFGYIRKQDVIVWDTDQALRFVGEGTNRTVGLFADPALTDKVGDASVDGPNDPTVEPFPIFRKTQDGTAFEIAFVYTAGGGDDPDAKKQAALQRVITRDINKADVVFVMDITGSMQDELTAAANHAGALISQFAERTFTLPDGREAPMLFRFGFFGYRDIDADGDLWKEVIDFHGVAEVEPLTTQLKQLVARGGGDQPESVYEAIQEACRMPWDRESGKAIVLIGDAPPKNPGAMEAAIQACKAQFIRVHSIVVGDHAGARDAFRALSLGTGGQMFSIADAQNTDTVDRIVDSLEVEQSIAGTAADTIRKWADGADLSRDVQEFVFRGIIPDFASRPIPPTVYVSSKLDGTRQVCLYKSKPSLYEMLGGMQTDFVGMIEDPSPELLTAIAAGGVEFIAELDPHVLQSILDLDDPSAADAEVKAMLEAMPELPGMIRELHEQGSLADWHSLARKTTALSRFVSDPANFYRDHAWVPFDVLSM